MNFMMKRPFYGLLIISHEHTCATTQLERDFLCFQHFPPDKSKVMFTGVCCSALHLQLPGHVPVILNHHDYFNWCPAGEPNSDCKYTKLVKILSKTFEANKNIKIYLIFFSFLFSFLLFSFSFSLSFLFHQNH